MYGLSRRSDIILDSLEAGKGYTLSAARGSFEASRLLKKGFVAGENLVHTVDYLDVWRMLLKGRADLTYANELIADSIHLSLQQDKNTFEKKRDIGFELDLYIAASLGTPDKVVSRLQQVMAQMHQDGTFKRILQTAPQQH